MEIDNDLERINSYLDTIIDYYYKLKGTDNLTSFLKKEVRFVGECLDLIDLRVLPLSHEYVQQCKSIVYNHLEKEDFLKVTNKLSNEVINTIFQIKNYIDMSKLERDTYDCFICLLPPEIEASDLLIEIFIDRIFDLSVKTSSILPILYNNFKEIIDRNG